MYKTYTLIKDLTYQHTIMMITMMTIITPMRTPATAPAMAAMGDDWGVEVVVSERQTGELLQVVP